jgi:hypothetical protein
MIGQATVGKLHDRRSAAPVLREGRRQNRFTAIGDFDDEAAAAEGRDEPAKQWLDEGAGLKGRRDTARFERRPPIPDIARVDGLNVARANVGTPCRIMIDSSRDRMSTQQRCRLGKQRRFPTSDDRMVRSIARAKLGDGDSDARAHLDARNNLPRDVCVVLAHEAATTRTDDGGRVR